MTFLEYFESFDRSASAAIMGLVVVGLVFRKNRRVHPTIMTLCFLADLALVAYIELSRGAIETAVGQMTPLLAIHIVLAVGMLVLYGLLTHSGLKIMKGDAGRIGKHRNMAVIFLLVRIAVMVTAVMVAQDVHSAAEASA